MINTHEHAGDAPREFVVECRGRKVKVRIVDGPFLADEHGHSAANTTWYVEPYGNEPGVLLVRDDATIDEFWRECVAETDLHDEFGRPVDEPGRN